MGYNRVVREAVLILASGHKETGIQNPAAVVPASNVPATSRVSNAIAAAAIPTIATGRATTPTAAIFCGEALVPLR